MLLLALPQRCQHTVTQQLFKATKAVCVASRRRQVGVCCTVAVDPCNFTWYAAHTSQSYTKGYTFYSRVPVELRHLHALAQDVLACCAEWAAVYLRNSLRALYREACPGESVTVTPMHMCTPRAPQHCWVSDSRPHKESSCLMATSEPVHIAPVTDSLRGATHRHLLGPCTFVSLQSLSFRCHPLRPVGQHQT